MIAPYSFTMEKLLFVVRSLKERLVINLESLLLHGIRKQIKERSEGRSFVVLNAIHSTHSRVREDLHEGEAQE